MSGVQISSFRDHFEKLPDRTLTIAEWLAAIRDGLVAEPIARIRASRGTPAYDKLKKGLRCITWAGTFSQGRKHDDPCEPSGLVFLELDHHDGAPDPGWLWSERMRLSANPSTVSVYTSAGGQGLHVVAAVNPIPCTPNEYRQAWGWVSRELGIEASGDRGVGHRNRLAAVSHDARIYTNLAPTPIAWEPAAGGASGGKSGRSPETLGEAFQQVAMHFGVTWDGTTDADLKAGFRMACPYHGGTNPTSLHVWVGESTDAPGDEAKPTLYAKCHSRDCDGPIVLRFVAREAGVDWPLKRGIFWPAIAEDALRDTLALLRLDMRLNRGSGQVEVRSWPDFKPDRILAETGVPFRKGWVSVGGTFFDKALRLLARRSFKLAGTLVDWDDSFIVGASASPFSGWPFRQYLEGLPEWDGTQRLYRLFHDALGAADTELNRVAATSFLVGALRRTFEPGCAHDWLAVLIGEQGLGKSRFCRSLLPPEHELALYSEDLDLSLSPQQLAEAIGGSLIAEFSEMSGIRSTRATEGFKSFISTRQDRYRKPYHRAPSENPRTWVGIGTSNDEAVPADPSGSRRYLAVQCGETANWDYVPSVRDQLWGEALSIYRSWVDQGSPNPPPNILPADDKWREEQERINAAFTGIDADFDDLAEKLEPLVTPFVGKANGVKILKLWELAHSMRATSFIEPAAPPLDRSAEVKFAAALTVYGWSKGKFNDSRIWFR